MNRDPQILIVTPRRRGRPRAAEPGTTVCAWVKTGIYDSLNRIANERSVSMSALVGQVLERVVSLDERRK